MSDRPDIDRVTYWKTQIRRTSILLIVWFVVAYVMSIFLAETLNSISFGGIPFGFWMAQQGSIFVFVSLVLIYAVTADQLDKDAGVAESDDSTSAPGESH
jgi:putative solute:sodium symporter small subunit